MRTTTSVASAVRAPKLATVVARQIEDEVMARGWPEGEVLGSERELLEHFGVSRAVLREAARIVEHTGAARMRRGPGGGLVVAAFNRDAVTTAMTIWLSYLGVSVEEISDARGPLVVEAARLAAARRTDEGVRGLRERLDGLAAGGSVADADLTELDRRVTVLSGNLAIALFTETLSTIVGQRLEDGRAGFEPRLTAQDRRAHLAGYRRLVEAIASHDGDRAAAEATRLTTFVGARLRDRAPRRPRRRRPAASAAKLSERVVAAIRADIEAEGWPIDAVLGSESDLIERYGVSRAVLREAVRVLEFHGAVRTKRGPGGGLVVSVPDGSAILRSARMALEFDGVMAQHLLEVRSALDVSAARMAATRLTGERAMELERTLATERAADDSVILTHDVHRTLATATGSRPLALFVDITAELVSMHVRPHAVQGAELATTAAETRRAHDRIIEAVLHRDPDLAARRMLRHLNASLEVLR